MQKLIERLEAHSSELHRMRHGLSRAGLLDLGQDYSQPHEIRTLSIYATPIGDGCDLSLWKAARDSYEAAQALRDLKASADAMANALELVGECDSLIGDAANALAAYREKFPQ